MNLSACKTIEEYREAAHYWQKKWAAVQDETEWLWDNCKIIYYPSNDEYPIEHNPHARKNSRHLISSARSSLT